MPTKFETLRRQMTPERQARVEARTQELLATMPLNQLRKARSLSQEELAEILDVNQATVSKLERRADMYISTMRRFVRAMGGELEIHARFPEGVFEIDQFGALPSSDDSPAAESAIGTKVPTRRRSAPKKKPRRKK
jgi:transcriptional regulator with XRE-family HTH domain